MLNPHIAIHLGERPCRRVRPASAVNRAMEGAHGKTRRPVDHGSGEDFRRGGESHLLQGRRARDQVRAVIAIVNGTARRLAPQRVLAMVVMGVGAREGGGYAVEGRVLLLLLGGADGKGARGRAAIVGRRRGSRAAVEECVVLLSICRLIPEGVEGWLHHLVRLEERQHRAGRGIQPGSSRGIGSVCRIPGRRDTEGRERSARH